MVINLLLKFGYITISTKYLTLISPPRCVRRVTSFAVRVTRTVRQCMCVRASTRKTARSVLDNVQLTSGDLLWTRRVETVMDLALTVSRTCSFVDSIINSCHEFHVHYTAVL